MTFGLVRVAVTSCVLLSFSFGLDAAQSKQQKTATNLKAGAETYRQCCAVCHGKAGKGDGPAASALKVAPPDLTGLARRHDGKFPDAYVSNVLRNGVNAPAHGTAEMPIWGPLFLALDSSFQSQANLRITNLVNYIKSIQE
jgi:mono/diheme cytochrome c family protein